MRTCTLLLFCLFSLTGFGQIDTTAVKKELSSMLNEAVDLAKKGEFELASDLVTKAEKLSLEKLGPTSLWYIESCNRQGLICYYQGDFDGARKWWLFTKGIRERKYGKVHAEYAKSLNNLAAIFDRQGHYERTLPLYQEAIDVRAKTVGTEPSGICKKYQQPGHLLQKSRTI